MDNEFKFFIPASVAVILVVGAVANRLFKSGVNAALVTSTVCAVILHFKMGYISRWAGLYVLGMVTAFFASLLISSVEIFILRKAKRLLAQRRRRNGQ